MFRKSAIALLRKQVTEWKQLIVKPFDQSQAIQELIDLCRQRTWDREIQDILTRIKTPGQTESYNPVHEQIREEFGETEYCPEKFAP